MLQTFLCCFRGVRGIAGDEKSPPDVPPTYTEACTERDLPPVDGWAGERTVEDGPATRSIRAKHARGLGKLAPVCAEQSQKGVGNAR